MPNPYSLDLRWRIVFLNISENISVADISRLLCVSESSIRRYLRVFQQTGDVRPVDHHHGPHSILGDFEHIIILRLIQERPSIYLEEIRGKLLDLFGSTVSTSTIWRTLHHKMGCSRQVVRYIASQQSELARAQFMAEISVYDPSMLIWIDESGCDRRDSKRKYGYSFRGITPRDHRLFIRGKHYSTIPLLSTEGIHDVYISEGSTDGDKFVNFLRNCLLPILNPFNCVNPLSVVIMDNASIHHIQEVQDMIENQGNAKLIFLPPYSPDLNPSEEVFSQVKDIIKENYQIFESTSAPRALLSTAFAMVTKQDCLSYIKHSGYIQ